MKQEDLCTPNMEQKETAKGTVHMKLSNCWNIESSKPDQDQQGIHLQNLSTGKIYNQADISWYLQALMDSTFPLLGEKTY